MAGAVDDSTINIVVVIIIIIIIWGDEVGALAPKTFFAVPSKM